MSATLRRMTATMTRPLVAWIYARVSDDKTRKGRSVDQQTDECTEWCDDEGWTIGRVITDNDRSASRYAKRAREGWEEVKQGIRDGVPDIVVMWEASRAQRDLAVYAEVRELCAANNVLLGYSGTVYDMRKASDRRQTGQDALDAEHESAKTSERVKRDVRRMVREGKPSGRIPYGYTRKYDEDTRELIGQVPVEPQASIIREAAARWLAGESTRSIAQDFNRRDIPTPYQPRDEDKHPSKVGWRLEQVRRIITNPAVNGQKVHHGKVVRRGTWEPILDDQTFARVVARFDDPARKTTRQRETTRLLSGVARCGVCGGPVSYAPQKGKGRKVRNTYRCRYGNHVTRDMRNLENYVQLTIIDWARTGGIELEDTSSDVAATFDRIKSLRAEIEEAVSLYESGGLSVATLGRIEASKLADIRQAERSIRTVSLPSVAFGMFDADDPETYWFSDALTTEQRREILRAMMDVVIHPIRTKGRRAFESETVDVIRKS